jgi:hypothetical protein
MFKTLGFCIKVVFFSVIVLILGNWLRWDGKTISDQVKLRMSHAERSNLLGVVRNWADEVTHDARKGIQKKLNYSRASEEEEEIPSSEKQKLKALIRELNSSNKKAKVN